MEKLNDFANGAYQMGEKLFRQISISEIFSRGFSTAADDDETQETQETDASGDGTSPQESSSAAAAKDEELKDTDDSSGVGMSVLSGDRAADKDASNASQRINHIKERTAETLKNAGKSLWGFFASAA